MIDLDLVENFLDREWLTRAWTFQEIVLASNPVIICGQRALPWGQLNRGIHLILDWYDRYDDGISLHGNKNHRQHIERHRFFFSCCERQVVRPKTKHNHDCFTSGPLVSKDWHNLFKIWMNIQRPTHWNNITLRDLPKLSVSDSADEVAKEWTVELYQQQVVDLTWGRVIGRSLIALVCAIALTVFVVVLIQLRHLNTYWLLILVPFMAVLIMALAPLLFSLPFDVYYWRTTKIPWRSSRQDGVESLTARPLMGLVQALRERNATVKHDHVFALSGVLTTLGFPPPVPSYDRLVGEVYQDLMLALLARPSLITLVTDAGCGLKNPPLPGTPSWVPDWGSLRENWWLPHRFTYRSLTQAEQIGIGSPPEVLGQELRLRAVLLGKANFRTGPLSLPLGKASEIPADEMSRMAEPLVQWMTVVRRDAPISGSYESLPSAVFEVICRGEPIKSRRYREDFDEMWRTVGSAMERHDQESVRMEDSAGPSTRPFPTMQETIITDVLQQPKARKFTINFLQAQKGRRGLFFSKDGHIGSGPPRMQEGDSIFRFAGVDIPMILRESDTHPGKWRVVGPTFIPGCMDSTPATKKGTGFEEITLV